MKLARRGFLKLLPVAGLAGKAAAEDAATRLAGLGSVGMSGQVVGGYATEALGLSQGQAPALPPGAASSGLSQDARRKILQRALCVPALRNELESMLYEDNRAVGYLDPDLASKRSFSLAAKVTFQRQRNVQRALEYSVLKDAPYYRVERWTERVLKWVWG